MLPETLNHALIVFTVDELRFALPLAVVVRVVHAVEITQLPDAPQAVLGVVDVHGDILPVYDLRSRCALPLRQLELSDQFIIARTARRTLLLAVDQALGIHHWDGKVGQVADQFGTGLKFVQGVIRIDDEIVLIQDVEAFLSEEQEQKLDRSLAVRAGRTTPKRA